MPSHPSPTASSTGRSPSFPNKGPSMSGFLASVLNSLPPGDSISSGTQRHRPQAATGSSTKVGEDVRKASTPEPPEGNSFWAKSSANWETDNYTLNE
ncbi:hypothetical protein L202_06999 [Cryptococcus amylolentus CBS 6039]|uniref:Uncharacterized protein n=2 Tax=Cryptococcus amylolentus TaxID=104669 RepID=A0A1E3HE98_9TREE|nr:hypothetical protein L202_06999 [Cryptococcus amylolentus CBS 6039]ODN74659.1 hypothetical protein L202_06999 [Cryptococcus amylolentus CBS 6039]ODO01603.1 hypothetical protein I350_06423 [Cryptococcus amylolentus CBS 6273]